MTPELRTWIYGVVLAAIPLLIVAGLIAANEATLWLNLTAALLGLGSTGTATAYRPTRRSGVID